MTISSVRPLLDPLTITTLFRIQNTVSRYDDSAIAVIRTRASALTYEEQRGRSVRTT